MIAYPSLISIPLHVTDHLISPISNIRFGIILTLVAVLHSQAVTSVDRPNVLLIMADDMGWSDIGCYGGEIPTPHIDSLAQSGLRFRQFYNTSRCSPTRAALLTGLQQHQAGMGILAESPNSKEQANHGSGYTRYLTDNSVTTAEVLKSIGYHTYLAGKWHLGIHGKEKWPLQHGFERFYGILAGASSYHRPQGGRGLMLDNEPLPAPTDPSYYTTDAFAQHMIDFIAEQKDDRPFFGYLAFTAPHWPLHARQEDIAKFIGQYREGWDQLRAQRWQRQLQLGVVEEKWGLSPRDDGARAWDTLTEDQKEESDYRMAVYAAQVHRMDHAIGRVIASLRDADKLENTLIIFLSDNGACAEPGDDLGGGTLAQINDPDLCDAISYGTGWANASNTPFRRYKSRLYEGGIATPVIMSWPARLKTAPHSITDARGFVSDIMPTILSVTGATYPTEYEGRSITPLYGRSLAAVFEEKMPPQPEWMFWEHYRRRAVRRGDWKIIGHIDSEQWELYDLRHDRTEQHNRAGAYPAKVREMATAWDVWAARHAVLPRTLPEGN